jgi:heat shock protein 4
VENPRYVAFIDFGHSKTSAFVGSFTKEKAQIVAQVNDRNFGARDIDWSIYEQYCEIFEGQSGGLSPKESKKAQLRLLEAIEKQRKVLSANSEAAVNVEYLMEDIDFNHNLKREEYEKLIENVLQRFSQILEFLAQQIQNLKIKLHSVEIVGGATRMPIVQQIIQSVLKVESVSKTLNASECIARGCAMMAAMRSPSFRVTEYIIEDANFYPIRVGWLFNSTLDTLLK